MNNDRRQRLEKIILALEEQKDELENLWNEETTAYEHLPDSLKESRRGENMYDAINVLCSATDDVGNVIDDLNEFINSL